MKHILDTALGVIDTMLRYSPDDPALLRLKMAALVNFADDYGRIGETAQQLDMANQARAIAKSLADAVPTDNERQRDLSVSYNKVGDVLVAQGNLPEALKSYRDSLAIRDRLARADPGNAEWQRDLSISLGRVAETLLKLDRKAEARPLAERALAQLRSAIARMPDDPRLTRDLPYYQDLLRRAGGTP